MILSECFNDVAVELERQKSQLDLIETNVEIALTDIIGGISDLEKVNHDSKTLFFKSFQKFNFLEI